jgi:NADP-dependent 3-hydroxy acid dehydrogenase YdfG
MAGSLEGRKALITGASSGIGAATAEAMVAEGAAVALGARRKDRLDDLASRIDAGGAKAVAIEADIADEAQAKSLVETAHAELGGLDTLINNAGVMLLGPLQGADPAEWRKMIEVNCLGLLYCTHYALPLIRDGGGGDVVNVSSVAGRVAALGAAVYNMTKWGVVGFSEALRQEALHVGVRVTCVEPGFVETELQAHNEHPMVVEAIEKMRKDLGDDVLRASDIANAIIYALSQPSRVAINEVLVRPTKQSR